MMKLAYRSKIYFRLMIGGSIETQPAEDPPQAIGHYENGRMGIPENRLRRLLALYDFTNDEFSEYLNRKSIPLVKDECFQLLDQIRNEDKLRAVHTILKSFVA